MNKDDFYKLHIGQDIWHKGERKTIRVLWRNMAGTENFVDFIESMPTADILAWSEICQDCSLEPPKEKKKVKLYRYTYVRGDDYYQSGWASSINDRFKPSEDMKHIKTETKEIEIDKQR